MNSLISNTELQAEAIQLQIKGRQWTKPYNERSQKLAFGRRDKEFYYRTISI